MTMSSVFLIHGNSASRPGNMLLKPGQSVLVAGPVDIVNGGQGQVMAIAVDGADSPTGADVTEVPVGETLTIPEREHRRLGVDANAMVWFTWPPLGVPI
jgi:hypothetical protein